MAKTTLILNKPIYRVELDINENSLETIGYVKVVRCKDCKHYWKNWKNGEPDWGDGVAMCLCSPKDYAFCSEGERRDDGEIHQG